jgi:hypothetical protein
MNKYVNIRCLFVAYTDRLKDSVKYIYENMCSGTSNYDGSSTAGAGTAAKAAAADDIDAQLNGVAAVNDDGEDNVLATAGYYDWQKGQVNQNNSLDYYRMKLLIRKLYDDEVGVDRLIKFPEARYVDFRVFKEVFWKEYLEKKLKVSAPSREDAKITIYVDVATAWTQIYSYIKGSVDTFISGDDNKFGRRELSRDNYVGFKIIEKNRCRIDSEHRERAYDIYEQYRLWLGKEYKGWDETDIVMEVLKTLNVHLSQGRERKYHKIYVDEVQDFTQAELGVLILASGRDSTALFMAGDSAQSINTGVAFRFEDVRSCFNKLKIGKSEDRLEHKETLTTNFRSHQGILKTASFVLNLAKKEHPGCLDNLTADMGLASKFNFDNTNY